MSFTQLNQGNTPCVNYCIATGSLDDTIKIWDPTTGGLVTTGGQGTDVYDVEWSSDATMIASVGDNTGGLPLRIFDTTSEIEASGSILTSDDITIAGGPTFEENAIKDISFSSDDALVAIAGDTSYIYV